ncbi:hypothetical protein RCL_jg22363.t1 [Rhizophagus clarus]|uniref:Uncharacterized protein n=1 Tax=Rhizophagus clarus TaxID=94130 RepID=A0A8H3L517_9GLOM|nr:hypothetical protein RCL_jg22363.t1 [Rhizophagus clarus]
MSLLNYPCQLMAVLLQKKQVGDPVSYEESCKRLKQVISGDTHHHTFQPIPNSAVDQLVDDAMQVEDQQHLTLLGPVPSSSTTTPKLKKNKVPAKAVEKIYTDFNIPED